MPGIVKIILYALLLSGAPFVYAKSLNDTVRCALKHASSIKQSRNEAIITRINRDKNRVEQFGEINLAADYTHYNSSRTLGPLTPSIMKSGIPIPETTNLYSIGVSYSVPLFTGFAHMRQLEISSLAKEMAKVKVDLKKEEIAYNVRSLYLTILAFKDMLRAQYAYTRAIERLKKSVKKEVELGKKARIDLIKAESELENAKTQIDTLKTNIETTVAALEALSGCEIDRVQKIDIRPARPKNAISALQKEIPSLAKVKLEKIEIEKAEKAILKSRAAKLPQISLNAYTGENFGKDIVNGMGWEDESLWQVGIHANWNLFDFGKRDLETEKARIAKMQSEIKHKQKIRDMRKLIKQGLAKIKESYSIYKRNRAQLTLNRKSESIEQVRYDSGVSTINDLLLAWGRTQLARAKAIESKYNYQKSIYYLDYLLERGVRK